VQGAFQSLEFSSRSGFNEVIKFSVSSRLELVAAVEPIVHFTSDAHTSNRPAEVFLGGQLVVIPGEAEKPTVAVSYFRRVYDGGAPELDLGSPRDSFTVLASADVKGFHYDTNAIFNQMIQGQTRKVQFGQTLSISHPLRKLTLSGEIWHFSQPFLHREAVGNLWAVAYPVRKNLVVDAGFNRGLTGTSTRWELFLGFTYLLPHRLLK